MTNTPAYLAASSVTEKNMIYTLGQCYKTYVHNLRMLKINGSVCT
jgi:hypothetical protein